MDLYIIAENRSITPQDGYSTFFLKVSKQNTKGSKYQFLKHSRYSDGSELIFSSENDSETIERAIRYIFKSFYNILLMEAE
jgi:hypothetical protein